MKRSSTVVHEVAHFSRFSVFFPQMQQLIRLAYQQPGGERRRGKAEFHQRHLHACLLCPKITIIHFSHHIKIQITNVVVRFDMRRAEVPSTAIFITSFIQIILFRVVCANNRPTQPPDVRRVFQHVVRSACETNPNLRFSKIYIL